MRQFPWHLAIIAVALAAVIGVASGWVPWFVVAIIGLGVLATTWVGARISTEVDQWLSVLLPLAFLAKMVGSAMRYFVVAEFYGYGDAIGYHRIGLETAQIWRGLEVPELLTRGGFGTQVTGHITGLLYSIVTPPLIGGFMVFATLSFIGMVCFYVAFRQTMPGWGVFPYFVLLFFLPTMVFWPSSVGKDALMVFALGLVALGTVWLFSGRFTNGAWAAAAGGLILGLIRPHVLAIAVGSIVLAVVFTRANRLEVSRAARVALMIFALVATAYVVPLAASRIGVNDGIESFLADQQERTTQGGSAVIGEPATSPLAVPEATIRVLFRPLPHEATTPPMMLSALETTALLLLVLWKLPNMWANRSVVRRTPYLLMSLAFSAAFVIGFSSIFNLGILARQRSQVIPFLIVVIIGLGWQRWSERDRAGLAEPRAEIAA